MDTREVSGGFSFLKSRNHEGGFWDAGAAVFLFVSFVVVVPPGTSSLCSWANICIWGAWKHWRRLCIPGWR